MAAESHTFMTMMNGLPDDRFNLFCTLFDVAQPKRREEKVEQFCSTVLPRLFKVTPNALNFLGYLVENLRATEMCNRIRDIPIPVFFSKWKGHRSIYKFVPLNPHGIDVIPSTKERKLDCSMMLGMFFSLGEPPPTCAIRCEKADVLPVSFGGPFSVYVLSAEGRMPQRLQLQFPTFPQSFLTWFIIEMVDRRPVSDVFKDLTAAIPNADERTLFAKTAACQGCLFSFVQVLLELSLGGRARCPQCGAPIVLSELSFETKDDAAPLPPRPAAPSATLALAECLGTLAKWPRDDGAWARELFGGGAARFAGDGAPIDFSGPDGYIAVIEHMA
jgi:predicted Zn-ribbon and HTH transcriptional regulator